MVNICKLVFLVGNLISITNAGLLTDFWDGVSGSQGRKKRDTKRVCYIEPSISEFPLKWGKILREGRWIESVMVDFYDLRAFQRLGKITSGPAKQLSHRLNLVNDFRSLHTESNILIWNFHTLKNLFKHSQITRLKSIFNVHLFGK